MESICRIEQCKRNIGKFDENETQTKNHKVPEPAPVPKLRAGAKQEEKMQIETYHKHIT